MHSTAPPEGETQKYEIPVVFVQHTNTSRNNQDNNCIVSFPRGGWCLHHVAKHCAPMVSSSSDLWCPWSVAWSGTDPVWCVVRCGPYARHLVKDDLGGNSPAPGTIITYKENFKRPAFTNAESCSEVDNSNTFIDLTQFKTTCPVSYVSHNKSTTGYVQVAFVVK